MFSGEEIRVFESGKVSKEELEKFEEEWKKEQEEIAARGYPEWMDGRLAKVWNARVNLISMQLRSPENILLKESIQLLTDYIFRNGDKSDDT